MDINGFSFFTDEFEDLPQVVPASSAASPRLRARMPDEGDLLEGEIPPEDTLQAIRSWFGF